MLIGGADTAVRGGGPPNMDPSRRGWGNPPSGFGGGGTTAAGGGGNTIGSSPWRWANFSLAAICFFHFVRRFWNHVLICTSVKFKFLDNSKRLETDRYLSA